jgi:hypothetical protein
MVRATTDPTEVERFELESIEGGWVDLRLMDYGQILERQEMAGKMGFEGSQRDLKGVVEMMQKRTREFEFRVCIADHNLEDKDDKKLNFTKAADVWKLNPRIGAEIEQIIERENTLDLEDSAGKVRGKMTSSSESVGA